MKIGSYRGARSVLAVASGAALMCACLLSLPAPAGANTVTSFCVGNYGGGGYCNQGHFHSIWWIDAQASADAFCVSRAKEAWAGAPTYSGVEYCAGSGSGGFVAQEFYGYGGYAQVHNRHSYEVSASPGFEYS
jgi:hypothetical protein